MHVIRDNYCISQKNVVSLHCVKRKTELTTKKLIVEPLKKERKKKMKKEVWKTILQVIIAVLTAVGTTLGVTSCM